MLAIEGLVERHTDPNAGLFGRGIASFNGVGRRVLAAVVVMWILCTAWTVMRIVSQRIRKLKMQVEDYLYFVGYVS